MGAKNRKNLVTVYTVRRNGKVIKMATRRGFMPEDVPQVLEEEMLRDLSFRASVAYVCYEYVDKEVREEYRADKMRERMIDSGEFSQEKLSSRVYATWLVNVPVSPEEAALGTLECYEKDRNGYSVAWFWQEAGVEREKAPLKVEVLVMEDTSIKLRYFDALHPSFQ